jgi:hypothetical protein
VSRTYRASNGSFVDAISAASVNYKDSSGSWQPIDNSLTTDSSGSAHVNKANRYTATLPNDLASAPVRVDFGSSWVTQQIQGASATGSVDGATETYAGALPSTSVAYTAGPDQLTELLKLDSLAAPKTFTFDFKASPGTTVQKNKQGQIVLTDSSGKVSFVVPAPVMTDAAGATSGAITMSVQPSAGGATVSLTPDRTWLSSSERMFPVTVDPSVTLGNDDADCYINSGTPNSCTSIWRRLLSRRTGLFSMRTCSSTCKAV